MKTQLIKVDGVITDDLSNCKYKVVLDNGRIVYRKKVTQNEDTEC